MAVGHSPQPLSLSLFALAHAGALPRHLLQSTAICCRGAECSGKVDKNSDRGCDDHMMAASDNSIEKINPKKSLPLKTSMLGIYHHVSSFINSMFEGTTISFYFPIYSYIMFGFPKKRSFTGGCFRFQAEIICGDAVLLANVHCMEAMLLCFVLCNCQTADRPENQYLAPLLQHQGTES